MKVVQMSMAAKAESMDVYEREDYFDVMNGSSVLQNVLQNLLGLEPHYNIKKEAVNHY